MDEKMNLFIERTEENDDLSGSAENETLTGGLGNNSLARLEGDDLILGGIVIREDELDSINARPGIDTIASENDNDTLNGGLGNDDLRGEEGNNLLFGETGVETIDDFLDPATYGDSAIAISFPQEDIVGH